MVRVQGSPRFKIKGSESRVEGLELKVWRIEFRVRQGSLRQQQT